MPNAREPNAPCVLVWLSPQAMVMPGRVMPSSGPMTWTMPCLLESKLKNWMPVFLTLFSRVVAMSSACGSAKGRCWFLVGMMWSTVANVRLGKRTVLPVSFKDAKACGVVTSWIRWRPINSWSCPVGSVATLWWSQTLS